ncbi:MAG: FliM/FliN family flagellar motor switch protein [Patulibacter minatonensis]
MSTPLEQIADLVGIAVPEVLAGTEAGPVSVLPRGADPFAGAERPLLLTATRWTAVSPGGIVIGGVPEALATILGFELPARPEVSAEDASQQRRATDGDEEDETEGDAPEPEAEAEPEANGDDEPDAAQGDASGEEGDAPAPTRRWSDRVADAAKDAAGTAADGFIRALATLVGLPPGAAATQALLAESDAMVASVVGPLPDAVIVPLRREGVEVRLVVVVPGIVSARVAANAGQVGSASGPGAGPVEDAGAAVGDVLAEAGAVPAVLAQAALRSVPLELSAEIGTTSLPLSSVLALREGAVVELDEAVDAPVQLVAGSTPVASGELELDETGGLVLHVTAIPGRPDLIAGPALVDEPPVPFPEAAAAVPAPAPVDVPPAATDAPREEPPAGAAPDGVA